MKTLDQIPEHIKSSYPPEVIAAFKVFTDEELESLYMAFADDNGRFEGIGFTGPAGRFTKFAEPDKAEAIAILEEQCRREMATSDYHSAIIMPMKRYYEPGS